MTEWTRWTACTGAVLGIAWPWAMIGVALSGLAALGGLMVWWEYQRAGWRKGDPAEFYLGGALFVVASAFALFVFRNGAFQ